MERVLVAGMAGELCQEPASGSVSARQGASRRTKIDSHEEAEADDALYDEQRGEHREGEAHVQYRLNVAEALRQRRPGTGA